MCASEASSTPVPLRLTPSPEQVEINLIGLAPGDPVMVCVEQQLPPRLVDGLGGIAGRRRGGDGGECLRIEQDVLRKAVRLLGVDEGDVLPGVEGFMSRVWLRRWIRAPASSRTAAKNLRGVVTT